MSEVKLSKPYKQRFKGVENFLRRVAFNLGNTPSQTEVKIISCIPIDVTDLQAKIQFLERQLQETSKASKSKPSTQIVPLETLKSGTESEKGGAVCAKDGQIRDKGGVVGTNKEAVGHENDAVCGKDGTVGDKSSKPNTGSTVVNTILYGGSYACQPKTVDYSEKSLRNDDRSRYKPSHSGGGESRRRKSNVSFVLPAITTMDKEAQPCCSTSSHENVDTDYAVKNIAEAEHKLAAAERYYNYLFKKSKRKEKVSRRKSKLKTHLVYFAQHADNNPFNAKVSLDPFETLNNTSISNAYLDNVIRKQYDPKFVVQEFSDTSHFSRPICRDISENFTLSRLYESDVCSCCHGRFQNIDNYMPKGFDFINKITQCEPNYTNKTYYDSNLYDVVPVKETTNKFLKESNLSKRDIEIRCWPEQLRSKYRHDPKAAKYQAESPLKRRDNLNVQTIKHNGKSEQYNVDQTPINKQAHETSKVATKRCCIDYSNINKNDTRPTAKVKKFEPVKTIVLKNQSIETDNLNTNLLRNNQSTQLELIPDDNKTESTLNQIKSILQSVLAEVKTNSKVNGSMEKSSKRDAVVQKGASQNNMQGQSTLLHSFTYNQSYNANPYLPSCSRQLPAGQCCLAGVPYQPSLKYMQNFPVLVHPSSGRRLCACYYENSSRKPSKNKQSAATTNTNKERAEEKENTGKKETEILIKEIYKSMAATMDFPMKDNSASEYDDVKSTKNDFITESNIKVRNTNTVVDKRDIEVEALLSSNVSSNSKLVYNTANSQPKDTTPTIELRYDKATANETNHDKILHRFEKHSTETILEDDEETETSSDETDDEDIVDSKEFETPVKHERKGLLQRMFDSVKMFKKRKVDQKIQSEASEASDSDDYETIYSGKTAVLRPKDRRQNDKYSKLRSADENAFIRSLHEKGRRSPYLEQEYRRQWNERLMFDKQQERKYSSERPFSKQTSQDTRPMYWNNYEARSVLVDKPSPLKYVPSIREKLNRDSLNDIEDGAAKNKVGWLKKQKLVNCGEQWKKFILEN